MASAVGVLCAFLVQFLAVVGLAGCGAATLPQKQGAAEKVLTIDSQTGTHSFTVELALTEPEQRKGLMFRREMAPDHGMLFIYDPERQTGMWMKNTYISLDMLFVKKNGDIVKIAERTEPFSEKVISVNEPVYAVLELVGGTASRLGIAVGDRMQHPMLGE